MESKCAVHSITEPGEDHCLIDWWSVDPFPSRVPILESSPSPSVPSECLDTTVPSRDLPPPMYPPDFLVPSPLLVSSSSLDPSVPLVSSCSSALAPPLAPCGSLTLPRGSLPPGRHEIESSAAPRACRPMSPLWPVSPLALPRLYVPSAPTWSISPRTQSVVALAQPCTLESPATPLLLHQASPSLWLPCHPRSLRHRPGLLIPRLGPASQQLHLGLPGCRCRPGPSASLLHQGLHAPWFRLCQSQSSAWTFCQSSTLAPPTVGSKMVSVSICSSWSLSITISTPSTRAPPLPPQMDLLRHKDASFRRGSYCNMYAQFL
ncbi:uncharacterized protein LOC127496923 [Ctenopharyngodon idella]|uniref:uncharacterized protein LOC127496923 n=1 Tax=Ctenopharyngodon idella TaxID=7959 RepID=UPI002232B1E6|nr:uncharacterized protein LOC127496923 [Ctenopharyngodon idella]XP_051720873.1 uncharacterized protein LOC127496923 [Ctenopharyngodon idella]